MNHKLVIISSALIPPKTTFLIFGPFFQQGRFWPLGFFFGQAGPRALPDHPDRQQTGDSACKVFSLALLPLRFDAAHALIAVAACARWFGCAQVSMNANCDTRCGTPKRQSICMACALFKPAVLLFRTFCVCELFALCVVCAGCLSNR